MRGDEPPPPVHGRDGVRPVLGPGELDSDVGHTRAAPAWAGGQDVGGVAQPGEPWEEQVQHQARHV